MLPFLTHTYIKVFFHVIFIAKRTSVASHGVMYNGKMFTFQVPSFQFVLSETIKYLPYYLLI